MAGVHDGNRQVSEYMAINLARKWRAKQFDEIVGQPLAVRLVKNSLYRSLLFPVYLLSGTRGTGKTSMARIFAAALNCKELPAFQKDPQKQPLPCLVCASCEAMQQMNHPDFIEIDAASHTGVDNVRQIIDAASFVPVLGTKKIYLIDEAHMLSKAAFNAFLKILEEPPDTVVFMLATTDPHKIIQTVTSRCFQLYFDPIKPTEVVNHLITVCEQESLSAEPDALMLIAQETEGSMRDALNLLERLRALPEVEKEADVSVTITKQTVIDLLGSVDDGRLCELLNVVVAQDEQEVLATWERLQIGRYNPVMIWKKLVELLRRALWLKQGSNPDDVPVPDLLVDIVSSVSYDRLISLLDLCYSYELSFAKTAAPVTMLEMLFLKMVQLTSVQQETHTPSTVPLVKKKILSPLPKRQVKPEVVQSVKIQPRPQPLVTLEKPSGVWAQCLQELEKLADPLVLSIFKQGMQQVHNEKEKTLVMTFSKDLLFFKDCLGTTQKVWQPLIDKFFGEGTRVIPQFDGPSTKQRPIVVPEIKSVVKREVATSSASSQQSAPTKNVWARAFQSRARTKNGPVEKLVTAEALETLETGSLVSRVFPGRLMMQQTRKEGV